MTMITHLRSAAIAPGKTGEAITYARSIAKLVKEKYGTAVEILMPIGGNPGRIAWRLNHESMAQWEVLSAKTLTDPEYLGAVAAGSANFLPGSVHDDFWRTI
jgi:hypothetical protein